MSFIVILYGNRKTATIKKDYAVHKVPTFSAAKDLVKDNCGWGSIAETKDIKGTLEEFKQQFLKETDGLNVEITF